MTVGFSLVLLGPIYWLTQRIESSTSRQIAEVKDELGGEVESLRRSIDEAQLAVTTSLQADEQRQRETISRLLKDTSYDAAVAAFDQAKDLDLLSPLGVRADAPLTDFFLRIQLTDEGLVVHLDTLSDPSMFSEAWQAAESLDSVMLRLAAKVRPTSYWPGTERWEFASAIQGIVDVLLTALDLQSRGNAITNAVQKIDDEWLLSDWDARAIHRPSYQVTYRRLDESDWYTHLSGKNWTDRDNVGEMLDTAEFLRDLARSTGVYEG